MAAYFQAQTSSPLGDILALRNYALAMIRQSSSEGPTVTRHGPHHLAYDGINLRVSALTEFLRLYTLEASRSLVDLVFGHPSWVTITRELRVSEIGTREDWARGAADFGYSSEDSPFHDFLANIAFGPRASDWLLPPNNPQDIPQINRGTAIAYLTKIDSFLTDLLVLIHMTSGAPARGTEISQVLRAPSALGSRNLFFDPQRGLYLIRLTYSKTFSTTNIEQKAVRVVPESLSYLLLVYLAIVFPFRAFLAEILGLSLRPELLFCLYQGRVVSSHQLKLRLALKSETFIGERIGLRAWRHLAQGFIRYGMQEDLLDDPEGLDDLATDEAIGASQMHHSVRTGQLIYGRTKGQFNDLSKDTQDIYIEFTLRWHQYIGIGDGFDAFWHLYPSIPTTRSLAPVAPTTTSTLQGPLAPSSSAVLGPLQPSQSALTARFRASSPITPTVSLGLLEAFKGLQTQQGPSMPWDTAYSEEQLDPLQLFKDYSRVLIDHPIDPTTDFLLTLLREFLGAPTATFQSPEQREALLTLILNLEPSVFIVLPTGGGKTTLFLLSASLRTSKITLLVVPLVSLREDLLAKTKALGLKTTIWEEDSGEAISSYYGPQLVIVSAETATSPHFLPRARALGSRVDRIIFDEAHLIYTASYYRREFQRLRVLTTLGRPLVFTTATLSPQTLSGILDRLSLLDSPRVIRASINKPNLTYMVKSLPAKGSEEDHLRWTFTRLQEFLNVRSSQVICFFLYKNQVDQFAELFPDVCTPYHAGLSIEARASNLALFTSNSKRILAASSAIGAGFDFKNVGLITYFQGCWSLTDFVQGCGRAARAEGSRGSVLVLTKANGQLPSDQRSGDLSKASHELTLFHEWVKEGICRRRLLYSTYSPWLTGATCSGDDRLCDLCERRANGLAKQAGAAKATTLQQRQQLEVLKRYISQWSDGCCIGCLVKKQSNDEDGNYIYPRL